MVCGYRMALAGMVLALAVIPRVAAGEDRIGTNGLQGVKLLPSARAAGLAGAYTSLPGGAESVWTNPAGLAVQEYPDLLIGHVEWIEEIRQEAAAVALPLGMKGGLGIGASYLHLADLQRLDVRGNPDGAFQVWDGVITAGYGRRFGEFLSVGVGAKVLVEQLEDARGIGTAGDVGAQYDLRERVAGLRAGVVVQHVGLGPKFLNERADLPSLVRSGFSWTGFERHIMVVAEGEKSLDSRARFLGGLEVGVPGWVAGRLGYRSGQDAGSGLTLGLGVHVAGWDVDYAFVDYGLLGGTHWVNLATRFGQNGTVRGVFP